MARLTTSSRKPVARIPKELPLELERKALLKQVSGLPDCRVVALLAPSGFGKSTLLAQLARRSKRVVAWVLLTPDDASVLRLLEVLLEELKRMLPSFAAQATTAALAAQASAEGLGRALARDLNALEEAKQTVDIVLDRTEVLSASVSVFLEVFVEQLGEGHRVLLAGFASSPLPLSRWAARSDVLVFSADQLRFSDAETKGFAGNLEESALASLDGFPAALALAVQQQEKTLVSPQSLILERVQRLPQEIQELLPPLAVLDVWSVAVAKDLTLKLPTGFFETVLAIGLPLMPISTTEYRPHQLFLEVLSKELELDSARHIKFRVLVGQLYLKQDKPLIALEHFCAARDWSASVKVLEKVAPIFLQRHEYSLLKKISQPVPKKYLTQQLLSMLGYTLYVTGAVADSKSILQELSQEKTLSGYEKAILAQIEAFHGRYSQALAIVEEGLQTENNPRFRLELYNSGWFQLFSMGRLSEALVYASQGIQIAKSLDNPIHYAKGLTNIGTIYGELKKHNEADAAFTEAVRIYDTLGAIRPKLEMYNNWVDVALTHGRLQVALDCVDIGIRLVGQKHGRASILLLGQQGLTFYALNKPAKAANCFKQSLHLIKDVQFEYAFLHRSSLTQVTTLTGNLLEAEKLLAELKLLEQGSDQNQNGIFFTEALIAFCKKDYVVAIDFFTKAIPLNLFIWDEIRAYMFVGACQFYLGESSSESIAIAFQKIDDSVQHDTPLLSDFSVLEPFYKEHLLPNPLYKTRVKNLFALLESVSVERDTRPVLKVRSLGDFQVLIDDVEVDVPLSKSKEVLAFLLSQGSSLQKDLVSAVWEGARLATDYFRVAIRKLRLALTSVSVVNFDPLPLEAGRYELSEYLKIEWDVHSLEALLRNPDSSLEQLKAAYTGEFLPFAETDWAAQTRQRLQNLLVARVLAMAQNAEASEPLLALEAYQFVLHLEPLTDEAYDGLQGLAVSRGDRFEAVFIELQRGREVQRLLN